MEPKERTPVRVVPREQILEERQQELRKYESRYEMPSEKMAALMEMDAMRPTAEAIRWYQVYCGVRSLLEEETPTTGTRGTTTEPSTTAA